MKHLFISLLVLLITNFSFAKNPTHNTSQKDSLRKERNFLEVGGGIQGSLNAYNNSWINVSGGDNSIVLVGNIFLHHTYTQNKFFIETKFDAKLGYDRMRVEKVVNEVKTKEGIWFKNQDEFVLSVAPSFKMSENWYYGALVKFRSQFVNGYVSRTEQEPEDLKSKFLTPGYLDATLGVIYKSPNAKWPFTVNLSPLALSGTYASSEAVRNNGFLYGLPLGKSYKHEGGSAIQVDYDRTFGKTGFLRYRTTVYSFYGWITNYREAPVVRWENAIDIKATKLLTTTINFQLYYNKAQCTNVQTRTLLSVGLIYTFRNKEKK